MKKGLVIFCIAILSLVLLLGIGRRIRENKNEKNNEEQSSQSSTINTEIDKDQEVNESIDESIEDVLNSIGGETNSDFEDFADLEI